MNIYELKFKKASAEYERTGDASFIDEMEKMHMANKLVNEIEVKFNKASAEYESTGDPSFIDEMAKLALAMKDVNKEFNPTGGNV